jgi:hypothetical protein
LRAIKGFTERVYYRRSGRDSELRKEVQPISSGRLDRDAMMIGSVPCKLSLEVHVNGRLVFGAKDKGVEREAVATDAGRSFKCSWVMSAEGWEIVGPGYSVSTCTPGQ